MEYRVCRIIISEAINRILASVESTAAKSHFSINLVLLTLLILKIATGEVAIKAFVSNL